MAHDASAPGAPVGPGCLVRASRAALRVWGAVVAQQTPAPGGSALGPVRDAAGRATRFRTP